MGMGEGIELTIQLLFTNINYAVNTTELRQGRRLH